MKDQFSRYSGMAFEMLVPIALGALAGRWLDSRYNLTKPYFTAGLSLAGVFIGLYIVLKEFTGKK